MTIEDETMGYEIDEAIAAECVRVDTVMDEIDDLIQDLGLD